jgi:hypothetical protein
LEFIPSNLQQFSAADPKAGGDVPADLSLPDYQRDGLNAANSVGPALDDVARGT